jgi:hypothetical protein
MSSYVFFLLAGVLVIAGLVLWLIFRFQHGSSQLDIEKYRKKWLEIERQLNRDDTRSCQFAIIEADKLLDCALKETGVKGDTMGERMRTAKDKWSNRDAVWRAHKLRNQIVHETNVQVTYDTARRALAGFKRALKDIGAI